MEPLSRSKNRLIEKESKYKLTDVKLLESRERERERERE